MQPFDFRLPTRVIFGEEALRKLGDVARQLGFRRSLLVADQGLVACGHVEKASGILAKADVEVIPFHGFDVNPDSDMVEEGSAFAAGGRIDSIIGFGGGSSMDCAKGINFVLTNGGTIERYWGFGKACKPMLPMIAVPTTAGTGSEAQCYALISNAQSKVKMACGDPKAAFRIAILDPSLTVTQPSSVTAAAGFDAIAHAVETYVTTRRTPISEAFSREAWRLLEGNYERVLARSDDLDARGAMQLGAYCAGVAIENSMLGATHACANPLTARYGTIHGEAIASLLPSVVRWNGVVAGACYGELCNLCPADSSDVNPSRRLAARLERLAEAGGLPGGLSSLGVRKEDIGVLAEEAEEQWTGQFNPRPFHAAGALEIYRCAF